VLAYAFQPDKVRPVLAKNPLSNEPFEFFPPDAAEMESQRRFMTALRIVRRLRSSWVKPDELDLKIVHTFASKSALLEPENAYWVELDAAVYGFESKPLQALVLWIAASSRDRWDTGEATALRQLWEGLAEADGSHLAWQGAVALSHASGGPSEFIAKNIGGFAYLNAESRYATLLNASVILDSARSFSIASSAISMANRAVFDIADPIETLGQRRYEEVKSEFPSHVRAALGEAAATRALREQQNVESWQTFYRSGAPIAEGQMQRLKLETLLTASLPSALFMSSLLLACVGLVGTALATLLGPVLNPDRRVVMGLGLAVAVALFVRTGVVLLSLWALTLGAVLCIPQLVSRDEPIEWSWPGRVAIISLSVFGASLLSLYFVLGSTPAAYLLGSALNASLYGAVATVALSLSIPSALVWARSRRVSVLRAVGETLRLLGFVGALIGMSATILATPLALWRDSDNRAFIERWIRNEPATFRPDAPQ